MPLPDKQFFPIEELEERFLTQLKNEFEYIVKHPHSLAVKYKDIKISNLNNFPYQIHYLITKNVVRVFGVFHEKSTPKSWVKRLNT